MDLDSLELLEEENEYEDRPADDAGVDAASNVSEEEEANMGGPAVMEEWNTGSEDEPYEDADDDAGDHGDAWTRADAAPYRGGSGRGEHERSQAFRDEPRLFRKALLTRTIALPFSAMGTNYEETLKRLVAHKFEGRCCSDGLVRRHSVKIEKISNGKIDRDGRIMFTVVFECEVCFLPEGALVWCRVQSKVKSGLRVEAPPTDHGESSPFVGFLLYEHHMHRMEEFKRVQEGDLIMVRVLIQRIKLNEVFVTFYGELHVQRTREARARQAAAVAAVGPMQTAARAPKRRRSAEEGDAGNNDDVLMVGPSGEA